MESNIFKFSISNYIIRYGIVEIILMAISLIWVPYLFVLFLILSIAHIDSCLRQIVSLDPFQIERKFQSTYREPGLAHTEKTEKYYYINEMTNYRADYLFITIYGNIEYRKKHNINGSYDEKIMKKSKVKIYRGLKNEKKLIEVLKNKSQN